MIITKLRMLVFVATAAALFVVTVNHQLTDQAD